MKANYWISLLAIAIYVACFLVANASAQTNLIANPDFTGVGPTGPSTSIDTVTPNGSYSAASGWYTWANNPGMIKTDLVASTTDAGGAFMLHVYTTCDACGVFQPFLPLDSGPADVRFSVAVFVVQGCVGSGVGNGGQTYITDATCHHNRWITLKGRNGVQPGNEMTIYAYRGPAEFYVALAKVSADRQASSANQKMK